MNDEHPAELADTGALDCVHLAVLLLGKVCVLALEQIALDVGTALFLSFPCVCPEPVLVKCSFLYRKWLNKTVFTHLDVGTQGLL